MQLSGSSMTARTLRLSKQAAKDTLPTKFLPRPFM